jgi:hypothetical protein
LFGTSSSVPTSEATASARLRRFESALIAGRMDRQHGYPVGAAATLSHRLQPGGISTGSLSVGGQMCLDSQQNMPLQEI